MAMKIAFRADASIQIGTGHVMRCLTLGEELRRQGHQCLFICRNHGGNLADLIAQRGFELHLLRSAETSGMLGTQEPALAHAHWLGVPWQTDAAQTLEVLTRDNIDWLIVDHYALHAQWERSLAEAVGQIMVIDDLADREHECAVLLDQNLGRQPEDYDELVPPSCTKLIGPTYGLLRPEFAELRAVSLERRCSPQLKRILISLGGVDRTNVTGQVLEALSNTTLSPETEIDIVMGGSAPHLEAVKRQASELPFQATVSVNVSDMAERMRRADLAIGAAGGTAWERCCLGLPSVLLILADNQISGTDALVRAGAVMTPGERTLTSSALFSILELLNSNSEILAKMAQAAAQLSDGLGAAKICHTLQRSEYSSHE
ncbi:UDP-2,4-diacetamido-2,4,6-trideoxy-beta-L-altropyranose hydrolase [Marinobacter persicus]|uniref:UDP-2,4-diacetamido-2,4, 6-trideoxy-beta-L-altropyranose hydrolase n=1 Tax=Marinobacter persicus TaxID=930118 RepID=A0A2S6G6B3_9GAMM|nr:UDP-2,4-diacetamido-2,4,6-trideoxy-beta-L-altropyranose hydrolase [Marinobacter persicus]PPK51320.1 UDP-2,4-diacetamido-2,4,6-trideoxy-beta-L-altropyranose hydrolase [Marinobacter persicus]PPK54573.1 UDP-2,4-diacetamido-2,4,6-trideoxy-beta-L-altropyranose hydrolase [Marinobacter persicus]PPK57999.1 UDP-2,4-diacetamido-2,4,6-trideoxy-beta-L-altropyranose hydrolase [Marinobacter persicus]